MLRKLLAVLAGIVVLTAASFAIEYALTPLLLKMFPQALPDAGAFRNNAWVKVTTFAYGFLCVAAGGYVTGLIAGKSPVKYAAIMGLIQAGLTIMAMFSPEANHASTLQWILTAALSIPAAVAGGMAYSKRRLATV
jgi:hypothetical protein